MPGDHWPDQVNPAGRQLGGDESRRGIVGKGGDEPAPATERADPGGDVGCLASGGHPGLSWRISVGSDRPRDPDDDIEVRVAENADHAGLRPVSHAVSSGIAAA
jgi:hypothetical protein